MNCSLDAALQILGIPGMAQATGTTDAAIYKWIGRNRLPRTEFTGETNHAEKLEKATKGAVKAADLRADSLRVYKEVAREAKARKSG